VSRQSINSGRFVNKTRRSDVDVVVPTSVTGLPGKTIIVVAVLSIGVARIFDCGGGVL